MGESFLLKCEIHGSDLYGKVAKAILDHDGITDEGIANYTGILSIDLVRMILKDLKWKDLIVSNLKFNRIKKFYSLTYQVNIKNNSFQ